MQGRISDSVLLSLIEGRSSTFLQGKTAAYLRPPQLIIFILLGCGPSGKLGGRVTAVIEKVIASNAPKIAEVLILLTEHEVHHALTPEA